MAAGEGATALRSHGCANGTAPGPLGLGAWNPAPKGGAPRKTKFPGALSEGAGAGAVFWGRAVPAPSPYWTGAR